MYQLEAGRRSAPNSNITAPRADRKEEPDEHPASTIPDVLTNHYDQLLYDWANHLAESKPILFHCNCLRPIVFKIVNKNKRPKISTYNSGKMSKDAAPILKAKAQASQSQAKLNLDFGLFSQCMTPETM
ncbi:hypothetical protein B0H14DRAFT_2570169 [Mycena olivaceomarginata]|nr:hypothetical protein B0H14DRAFT_2570169 [Mycena olivaceomarginata]